MDAFVCLDIHHDMVVSILSEKYVCTQHNPDDQRCPSSKDACDVLSMMCKKPAVIVYRHVDTSAQIPKSFYGRRVLFTVKSHEISRDLVLAVGGLHNMYLCDEECEESEETDVISYVHARKKGVACLSKCRNWSDIVSFVNTKPKYRKEFIKDFLFISICIDVNTS